MNVAVTLSRHRRPRISLDAVTLRKRLKPYVKEEGSVRIYRLCAACQATREVLGQGTPTEVPELQIV